MKIIIHLEDNEAYRSIEDEEENIRAAYRQIIREIENILCKWQIQYKEIEVLFSGD